MPALTLAVEIADTVAAAKKRRQSSFDVKSKARELAKAHPNAGASVGDVTDILEEESLAAGIVPISKPH
ncbi:MAG: hypothetical protein E5X80_08605 [Mesorhizobium sp.]|uniref:hypothetical protein n=1 Tax=Mesorhizobium sp. TaxID=1871066 RepID=UPI000FE712D9|nr:hypothetical protein [Mesorhizobium sp.]RWM05266.1 MAG: hypothetical protein EOR71_24915 [Mesorhizobium sp.]TIO53927.1 MAG: hypothetical protein E5X78_06145 [Mesorhizobium sp.]TIO61554.1 MAG: hypothetical protein E5X79_07290 [Mesorhizobium sp.]TJV65940.1 MAG: hypothetical protein E5X80_08605 [Mesorhizobium sp.]